VRCIQRAVADVGGTVPDDKRGRLRDRLGLMQALAHAAPDVPKEKYPELGNRYRHHYLAAPNDLSLFDGVLPMLAD
jgi:phosphoglycolate phosphatase